MQENQSESERVSYILKKGYQCQKENLIKNFPYLYYKDYPSNKALIFSSISSLMENIELVDKKCQILLSESLCNLVKNLSKNENMSKNLVEIKKILMHFFIAISTLEKAVSDEYIINLNEIIKEFPYKIKIDRDLIEYATSLGKFGQNVRNRKFSVYFCVCLIRLGNTKENDIYKRILLLSEDAEKSIQFEIAYQIRYLLKENNSEYCLKYLVPILNNYSNNENDLCFNSILIESVLIFNNFEKIKNDPIFFGNLIKKIKDFFSINDFYTLSNDFNHLINIFLIILDSANSSEIIRKKFIDLIKQFLVKFYIDNEIKNSVNVTLTLKIDYFLLNYDKIITIFIKEKQQKFLNDMMLITINNYFSNQKNLSILYDKLDLIIDKLPNEFLNKNLIQKIFFFLNMKENNYYVSSNSIGSSNANPETVSISLDSHQNEGGNPYPWEYKENWLAKINKITKIFIEKENFEFMSFYIQKIQNISFLLKKTKDWRIQLSIIKSLEQIPKYLLDKYVKYPNYVDIINKIFTFCKDFLSVGRNYQVEKEICDLMTKLIKYSKNRDTYISYMKSNFLLNKSYFRRRIYCIFCQKCFDNLSFSYMKKAKIYTDIIDNLLIGEIPLIQVLIVDLLNNYKIFDYDAVSNVQTIIETTLSSKDIELKRKVSNYLNNANKNKENDYNEINREEVLKMNEEKRIENIEILLEEKSKKEDIILKRPKTKQRSIISLSSFGSTKFMNKISSSKNIKKYNEFQIIKKPRKSSMNSYFPNSIIQDVGKEIITTNNNGHGVISTSSSSPYSRIKKNKSTNNTNFLQISSSAQGRKGNHSVSKFFKSPLGSRKKF